MGSETRLRSKHFQDVSQYSKSDQNRNSFDRKYNVRLNLITSSAIVLKVRDSSSKFSSQLATLHDHGISFSSL